MIQKRLSFLFLAAVPVLFAAQLWFVLSYVAHEHTFHFWDYAMYANMATAWQDLWPSPRFWSAFKQSFDQNYNLLYAVPSLIGFWLFGVTRAVFIGTNFLAFAVPGQIGFGLIVARLFRLPLSLSLFLGAALAFVLPVYWYPLLQGYPDHGAAACLTFAVYFALTEKKSWRNGFLMGLLLGFAIVFRRHYAYPALALLTGLSGLELWRLAVHRDVAAFWRFVFFFLFPAGFAVLFPLVVLEPRYLQTMLSTNFTSLYEAYARGPLYFCAFAASRLGWLLLGLGFSGFILAKKILPHSWPGLLTFLSFFAVWLVFWAFGPSQTADHYILPVLPLLCLIGITAFGVSLFRAGGVWRVAGIVSFVFLIANASYALWFAPRLQLPDEPPVPSFFSWARPPWVREDYDQLIALASFLSATRQQDDHIVIAASSYILNQDLLRAIYADVLKDLQPLRSFLFVSEVDNVSPPSPDAYAGATVYVVPQPMQYHLPPQGQPTIRAFAALFPPPPDLDVFFTEDPKTFSLMNGVVVRIWRRKAWTPEALHRGLSAFHRLTQTQALWSVEKSAVGIVPLASDGTSSTLFFDPLSPSARLFYDRPLARAPHYRLSVRLKSQNDCQMPTLTAQLRTRSGAVVSSQQQRPFLNPGLFFMFLPEPQESGPYYLSLDIDTQPLRSCFVALEQLSVEEIETGDRQVRP